jgi:Na+-transporting NADH:ubiquinone oxidoreductase subunit NqrC
MRKRGFVAVALSAALFSINVSSAVADVTASPAPSIDSFKAAQEQYKKDRDAYIMELRDREMKMRAINTIFKGAVDKSATDAKTAMSAATTPEQKNSITAARRTAVATAIVARESAIAALGPLPTPPVEPQRPAKMSPQGMSDQKEKKKR